MLKLLTYEQRSKLVISLTALIVVLDRASLDYNSWEILFTFPLVWGLAYCALILISLPLHMIVNMNFNRYFMGDLPEESFGVVHAAFATSITILTIMFGESFLSLVRSGGVT